MKPTVISSLSLSISGNLNRRTASVVEKALKPLIRQQPAELVIDCSNLESIDSFGIGMLLTVAESLSAKGSRLRLAEVNPSVYYITRLTLLTEVIQVSTRKPTRSMVHAEKLAA